jgi:hypothetical protein
MKDIPIILATLTLSLIFISCSHKIPSDGDVITALSERFEGHANISFTDFKRINGIAKSVKGYETYVVDFTGIMNLRSRDSTTWIKLKFNSGFYHTSGFYNVFDTIHIPGDYRVDKGEINFLKTEKGWILFDMGVNLEKLFPGTNTVDNTEQEEKDRQQGIDDDLKEGLQLRLNNVTTRFKMLRTWNTRADSLIDTKNSEISNNATPAQAILYNRNATSTQLVEAQKFINTLEVNIETYTTEIENLHAEKKINLHDNTTGPVERPVPYLVIAEKSYFFTYARED